MGFGKCRVPPPLWEAADISNQKSRVVATELGNNKECSSHFIRTGRTAWWVQTRLIVKPKNEISGGPEPTHISAFFSAPVSSG